MSKTTNKQYGKALYEATKGLKSADLTKALANCAALLAREHKLKQADNIIAEFIKYYKAGEGIKEIQITAARELDDGILKKIKAAFGAHVEAEVKIDPALLGGVRVRTEDKILDASLRTQLFKLKQYLLLSC